MLNMRFKEAKGGFFNRKAVLDAVGRAEAAVLSKAGAFVRTRAKSSLRYRKAPSAPGQPPSAHRTMSRTKTNRKTGVTKVQGVSPLREFLFFAYDRTTRSVVVGPVRLGGKLGNAPAALEKGGDSVVRLGPGKTRSVGIAARPFMAPAMEAEAPKFPSLWRGAVTK